jgi:hypothetical protein
MSTVQFTPNSVLQNPADINPLANPAYQNPVQKIKELDNKTLKEIKTDTVTISQEAIAKSSETNLPIVTSDEKNAESVKAQSIHSQLITKSDLSDKESAALAIDEVSISSAALIKSTIFSALSNSAISNKPELAYEKLLPF